MKNKEIIFYTLFCSICCLGFIAIAHSQNMPNNTNQPSEVIIIVPLWEYTMIESLAALLKNEYALQSELFIKKLQEYTPKKFSYTETNNLLEKYIETLQNNNTQEQQIARRYLVEHLRAVYNFSLKELMIVRYNN
jgi:hypothetical protein